MSHFTYAKRNLIGLEDTCQSLKLFREEASARGCPTTK
jgi:hypothetical protein